MRKLYIAYVKYECTKKRFLRSPILETETHCLGYVYGEESECLEKADHMGYYKVGDTLHDIDFYPSIIVNKGVELREVETSDYVSFRSLQEGLLHEDFVQYCKDNFISLGDIVKKK